MGIGRCFWATLIREIMACDNSKVALVTASSAGLGAAIAAALVHDMRVVINFFSSAERAEALKEQLLRNAKPRATCAGPRVILIQADVSRRSELQRLIAETVASMGRLDLVVSNQGWTRITDFSNLNDNVEEEDWDRCFNVNVKSHLFLLHAAREHLEKTEGAFITVASVAGVKPSGSSIVSLITRRLGLERPILITIGICGDQSCADIFGEVPGGSRKSPRSRKFGLSRNLDDSKILNLCLTWGEIKTD